MFNNYRPFALCLCLAWLLAGLVPTEAQTRVARSKPGAAAATKNTPVERVDYLVTINSNKSVSMTSVDTLLERYDLPSIGLDKILREDLVRKKKRGVVMEPNILVMPDLSVDIETLVRVISGLRISKGTELTVYLDDGPTLNVPQAPKFTNLKILKPNPLSLIAVLDSSGKISLNSEPQGDATDFEPLTAYLKRIFKKREEFGVFRFGSNDIEKTVFLKIHPSKTVADLLNFAAALQLAGSAPLVLQVDDL